MSVTELTSRDNPVLKTIRLVASASRRAPRQLVLAEGVRVLEEVETAARDVEAVVFSQGFGSAPREKDLIERWHARNLRMYQVGSSLFRSVSSVQTPQGAIALVRMPETTLERIRIPGMPLILCGHGIQDPGNLGTLIRAAAAAGAALVCTTRGTASARNPKAIRSSAGAFFRLPVVEHASLSDLLDYCAARSIRLYRTDAREGVSYTDADLASPCAILLGNEGSGVNEEALLQSPAVRIPMAAGIESLNVAVAGGIILFEARRQRLESGGKPHSFPSRT